MICASCQGSFCGSSGGLRPNNLIAQTIIQRIIKAHNAGQAYKVMVVMPELPGNPGVGTSPLTPRALVDCWAEPLTSESVTNAL
jgi:hypothetical protein